MGRVCDSCGGHGHVCILCPKCSWMVCASCWISAGCWAYGTSPLDMCHAARVGTIAASGFYACAGVDGNVVAMGSVRQV